jgi:hypothetical protein
VIAVKNTRSGKKLKGRVTGFRTVEIVPWSKHTSTQNEIRLDVS